jgi:hypothetical protein
MVTMELFRYHAAPSAAVGQNTVDVASPSANLHQRFYAHNQRFGDPVRNPHIARTDLTLDGNMSSVLRLLPPC